VSLFSLAASIRATVIIEIGRFKGFSTLALAGALRFLDIGWDEPLQHKQRPDVDYSRIEGRKSRRLYSIDPYPDPEALGVLQEAGLDKYVLLINKRSDEVEIQREADLILIDGDHSYEGCNRDYEKFVDRHLRPGGYFILHDYFGWFDENGRNGSPIKRVADEIISQGRFQHILMDTGYQSFVLFRKPDPRSGI
jgi:predicted O-methyltransferase YrrM